MREEGAQYFVSLAGVVESGVPISTNNMMTMASGGGGQGICRYQALRTLVGAVAFGNEFNGTHREGVNIKLQ